MVGSFLGNTTDGKRVKGRAWFGFQNTTKFSPIWWTEIEDTRRISQSRAKLE